MRNSWLRPATSPLKAEAARLWPTAVACWDRHTPSASFLAAPCRVADACWRVLVVTYVRGSRSKPLRRLRLCHCYRCCCCEQVQHACPVRVLQPPDVLCGMSSRALGAAAHINHSCEVLACCWCTLLGFFLSLEASNPYPCDSTTVPCPSLQGQYVALSFGKFQGICQVPSCMQLGLWRTGLGQWCAQPHLLLTAMSAFLCCCVVEHGVFAALCVSRGA